MTSMVGIGGLPPWYELAEALCVALVIVLPLGWLWAALDYRSRAAVRLRSIGRRPAVTHVLIGMLAASIFFITAKDVLDRGPAEVLSQLNRVVRGAAQELAPRAHVGAVASSVSDLTAPGIAAAVIVTLAGLVMRGRWRDGGWLVVGLLGAWGVSAALKIAFAVARPRGGATRFVITGYGFPSAHVFLTAVACGLLIWSVARFRGRSPGQRCTVWRSLPRDSSAWRVCSSTPTGSRT
jgi:hypothetical protein